MAYFRYVIAQILIVSFVISGAVACSGGPSDEVGGQTGPTRHRGTTLSLVAYSIPQPGWSKIIPAFEATPAGRDVDVTASYGASGDQSRLVVAGKPADIVNFAVEPDMARVVNAGKVSKEWNKNDKGIAFGSVVTLVVRPGNPHGIHTWEDLLKPGIEVISPDPLSSGSAKWYLLAPYIVASHGGQDPEAGLEFVHKLISDHIKLHPNSGRAATDVFLHGSGDVMIGCENDSLALEHEGKQIEHIVPEQTLKIEIPLALIQSSRSPKAARAFYQFQYSLEGQRIWAQAGFRPANPQVQEEFASTFAHPQQLWTIDDIGGWKTVNKKFFDKTDGLITKMYI